MGKWSRLAGIGSMIAGGAAMFVPGGQMAGAALLSGGASILAGGEQADAAKKASEQLQTGAADAQAVNQRVYDQTLADLSPYMQVGQGAMGNLGGLVGLPPLVMPAASPSGPAAPTGAVPRPGTPGAPVEDVPGNVRRLPLAHDPESQQTAARAATESAYAAPVPSGETLGTMTGQFVMLASPDGREQKTVPRDQAAFYIARGARRV